MWLESIVCFSPIIYLLWLFRIGMEAKLLWLVLHQCAQSRQEFKCWLLYKVLAFFTCPTPRLRHGDLCTKWLFASLWHTSTLPLSFWPQQGIQRLLMVKTTTRLVTFQGSHKKSMHIFLPNNGSTAQLLSLPCPSWPFLILHVRSKHWSLMFVWLQSLIDDSGYILPRTFFQLAI